MADALYERATELLEADLGDELMALDVEAGSCFGFNPVATKVWRHLASSKSFDELRQSLLAEYDVSGEQCSKDLRELLENLVEIGLVRKVIS